MPFRSGLPMGRPAERLPQSACATLENSSDEIAGSHKIDGSNPERKVSRGHDAWLSVGNERCVQVGKQE